MGQREVNWSDLLHPWTAHFSGRSDLTYPEVLAGKPTSFTSPVYLGAAPANHTRTCLQQEHHRLLACRSVREDLESLVFPLERPSSNKYLIIIILQPQDVTSLDDHFGSPGLHPHTNGSVSDNDHFSITGPNGHRFHWCFSHSLHRST